MRGLNKGGGVTKPRIIPLLPSEESISWLAAARTSSSWVGGNASGPAQTGSFCS